MPSKQQVFNIIFEIHLYFVTWNPFKTCNFCSITKEHIKYKSQLYIKLNTVSVTPHRSKSEIILGLKYFQQKIYYNYYTDLDQQQLDLWGLLDQQQINSELKTFRTAQIYHLLKWDRSFHNINICLKLDYDI